MKYEGIFNGDINNFVVDALGWVVIGMVLGIGISVVTFLITLVVKLTWSI